MALDTYQYCPCGSGKKVKFCCSKDMLGDLEKVLRAIDGDQRVAALELIDRLLSEKGECNALLALKSDLLIVHGDFEAAEGMVAALQKASPHNPVGFAQQAILCASRKDADAAVEMLQQALENTDKAIAPPVYSAIGVIAAALLDAGNVLGARGHWLMQSGMAGDRDSQPTEKLMQLNLTPELPLLMKEDRVFDECPQGVPWRGEFNAAMVSVRRGTWLAACESLESLAQKVSGEPAILKNIAILRGWLGQTDLARIAWREYSQSLGGEPNTLDDAVEAEALAQLLDDSENANEIDEVTVTFPVRDTEKLMERLLSDKRVAKMPVDPAQLATEDSPAPKGVFWLLDRPSFEWESDSEVQLQTIPCILGEIYLFGRQTDRDAELEFATKRTAQFEDGKAALAEVAGEFIEAASAEKVTGKASEITETLTWRWHMPRGMPRERQQELLGEQQQEVLLNRWPEIPMNLLDGKRPTDVAADPSYRVRLLAAILLLELASDGNQRPFEFNELRRKLGLPENGPLEVSGERIMRFPLARMGRLRLDALGDEDLVKAFQRAVITGHRSAVLALGDEVLQREGTAEFVNKVDVFEPILSSCQDTDRALNYVEQAKQLASQKGESLARWLLTELSIRLPRGESERCGQLLQTLQAKHVNEPGVSEALYRMLVTFGVITPDGQPAAAAASPGAAPPAEGPEAPKLWTPGSDTAAAAPEGKSKLWVPGS